MGRRRLFRQDIGDHPPEIQEFLEHYWHGPRTRGGGFHRISIGAPSSAEVRQNAQVFGCLLLVTAVVVPLAYWKWAGDRVTTFGWITLLAVSAGLAASGLVLLRSSRNPGPRAPKHQPESHRETDEGGKQDLP